ncbi:membrane protein [Microbacterium mangrovi]|uniref:Membrane protein n=1 Tax=Microbacterium mangrovi TaxID=1348253 RepID=A0A0B2AE90_9MICO|nr:efflux RND transporter permease subunit [Microbacterium mangrovi]KHK99961.1 membrane protein [Microbacterium mangrovi]
MSTNDTTDVAAPVRTRSTPPPRRGRVLRVILSAALILGWFVAAGLGGPLFGKVDEVSSNEPTAYLPSSADATKVQNSLPKFLGSDAIPAVVVFRSSGTIDAATRTALGDAVDQAAKIHGVVDSASPVLVSKDGRAAEVFLPIDAAGEVGTIVAEVGDGLRANVPAGIQVFVTGPAGFTADLVKAFSGIDGLLLGAALLAVFIILVAVYRSLLLPVVVLLTSMFALCVALLVVWWLAKDGVLLLSGQTQGILFILVIGAATDYSLLLVARFREELRSTRDRWTAVRRAWVGAFEPILAAGGTVIAGLLCLLFSDLKSNSTLGPVAAIGIVFAMLAALTLLPALLFAFGRAVFWPRRPPFEPDAAPDEILHRRGPWPRVAAGIRSRPRLTWIAATVVLLAAAAGATQLQADGVAQSDLVLGHSDARAGQTVLGDHFPAGSGSPVFVLVDESRMQDAADSLLNADGIGSVSGTSKDSPSGAVGIGTNGPEAFGPPGTPAPALTVVGGRVLLQATLTDPADSAAAADTVRSIRSDLASTGAKVGGVTATAIDTDAASIHDRTLIIPIVLLVILLILMLLLRAIVAPLLLVLTTLLSFASALGVSALVFDHGFRFPGADPAVPLFAFVFLVALGVDYNIFLMTRVREESREHGTRDGILRGLVITGGVITSAGIVLASTFAALAVIPILFLVQIAFIVAFGVLLDTFLVRSLLVPALSYDIGRAIWWPSRLSRSAAR